MPTTIFSASTWGDHPGLQNYSLRDTAAITGDSLGQVRVTFQAGSSGTLDLKHAAIAIIGTAIAPNTQFTPTELLFGGVSGFTSLASNATITSDWVNFSCLATDTIMVIMDIGSTNGDIVTKTLSGANEYYQGGTVSYNQSTVTGFGDTVGGWDGVTLIETQAAPIVGTPNKATIEGFVTIRQ